MVAEPALPRPPTHGQEPARTSVEPRARTAPLTDQQLAAAHVVHLLHQVAEVVRAGDCAASKQDGVLVDVVVGGTRCVLLAHEPSMMVRLSPREQEVARMVAFGRTNQAIASALDISVWTVSSHLRRIFSKLAVSTRTEMVAQLLGHRGLPAPVPGTNRVGSA